MKKRLLILKDNEQNTLLEIKLLNETDNITYSIIDNPPIIENIEGKIGKYVLDNNGNIIVEYKDIPKTEVELLQEENQALQERLAFIQESDADNILLINELQLALEELQSRIVTLENGGAN